MLVELSLNDLLGLLKLSSIGKLMSGLLHNLNGPLQNLGMDMELMNNTLMDEGRLSNDQAKDLSTRLDRMEAEFDRIKKIIMTFSMKVSLEEDYNRFININEFLRRELSFFEANLYFKHNVNAKLQLQDGLPLIRNPPKDLKLALSCFIQAIIEELESQQIKRLNLKTSFSHSDVEIMISTGGANLSKSFLELLDL